MFKELNKIISNEIREQNLETFSVIIGESPSKGARSPILWNKVYAAENKKTKMLPLDVSKENLKDLFLCLKAHPKCLGGAVAVPYKESMFNLLKDNLPSEINSIGAVNCFYRKNKNPSEIFTGTNTDGEGALESIHKFMSKEKNKNIALLGYGGAGKAILAFLLKDFGNMHNISVFNRNTISERQIKNLPVIFKKLNELQHSIPEIDLIINSTSLGSNIFPNETPIDHDVLINAREKTIVYDIIYDPPDTKLLKIAQEIGLKTINGLNMNLVQAVLAFQYTNKTAFSQKKICTLMNS